jgi:hypothetical protein
MVVAKNVRAEPKTETDWLSQTIRKVRKPFGGGSYRVWTLALKVFSSEVALRN